MRKFLQFFTSRFFILALLLTSQIALIVAFSVLGILTDYGYYYLVAALILNIPFLVFVVNSKANETYKLAWMLLIAIVPVGGALFYLLFANKRDNKRQRKKIINYNNLLIKYGNYTNDLYSLEKKDSDGFALCRALYEKGYIPPFNESKVNYYFPGEKVLDDLLKDLKEAKNFIFIEFYIIELGYFWDQILNVLIEKAKEGVEIRILYDDFGCMQKLPYRYDKQLKKYGIECKIFNIYKPFLDIKMNNRDHRKLIIIDGLISYTGGINIADEYINKKVRFGQWRDNCIRIKGKATFGNILLFLSNWDNQNNLNEDFSKYKIDYNDDELLNYKDQYVQPFGDVPFDYESLGESNYLNLINSAKKYLYISTPYLVLTESLIKSLIQAKRKGVDVRIVIPGIPDKKITYQVSLSYAYKLISAGIKIYKFMPGFNHEKTFLVDDKFATVGTINLDLRSEFLNYENAVFLYNNDCLKDIKEDFNDMFNKSIILTSKDVLKGGFFKKIAWAILNCFASMF